ncbi:hypothetical protein BDW74DRAFT_145319 [Aspergillus multicolor]|uniref:uncharacterized protein n=1 Tax=Aspergillus multicolor TaxID=41759 RepID=UPI003CCCEF22
MDCLKGFLKDLFIHIGYPAFNSMSDTLNAQEKALEQSIMGSSYENSTRGKPDMVKLEKYWGPV